jgi:hypothetical protein
MSTMIKEVNEALVEADASEAKASAAAEAVAGYENRFVDLRRHIDDRFGEFEKRVDNRFNNVDFRFEKNEVDIRLIKWILGFNLAFVGVVLFTSLT